MEILAQLKNVSFSYPQRLGLFSFRKKQVLKDISFKIHSGSAIGIVGRNGAGKSTLVRIIGGIYEPCSGEFILDKATTSEILSLQLGFMQELSGIENARLAFYTKKGIRGLSWDQFFDNVLSISELKWSIKKPLKYYSSGMRARLGFAIAYQMQPDILIVDEALGVGDEGFRDKSASLMMDKIRSNQTVIFISHNADMVGKLCDNVVWIENGEVKRSGDPKTVLEEYKNTFV